MGVNLNLQTALDTRLSQMSGIDIAYNNIPYTPTIGNAWIRPTLLPAATTTFTLGGVYLHKGIYQIDIFVPADNGMAQLYELMDTVTALYKDDTTLAQDCYVQTIGRGRSMRDDAWLTSYIQIDYIYYYN